MAKYIGETNENVVNGSDYPLKTVDMAGRFYEPDKDENGKWLDTVGWPDTRIMVWVDVHSNRFYKVYDNVDEILKEWSIEGNFSFYSPRIRQGLSQLYATV
jgi:hypothetical protein